MRRNITFRIHSSSSDNLTEKIKQADKELQAIDQKFKLAINRSFYNCDGSKDVHLQIKYTTQTSIINNDKILAILSRFFVIERHNIRSRWCRL